jgi:hypothetical protein
MSSAANITFESDTIGVPPDQWSAFCAAHDIVHSPQTVGGNIYYHGGFGGVEAAYHSEHWVSFSTYHGGRAMGDVARLAMLAWRRWGGKLSADPEIRSLLSKEVA